MCLERHIFSTFVCYEKFERMLKLHSFVLSCFTKHDVIEKA